MNLRWPAILAYAVLITVFWAGSFSDVARGDSVQMTLDQAKANLFRCRELVNAGKSHDALAILEPTVRAYRYLVIDLPPSSDFPDGLHLDALSKLSWIYLHTERRYQEALDGFKDSWNHYVSIHHSDLPLWEDQNIHNCRSLLASQGKSVPLISSKRGYFLGEVREVGDELMVTPKDLDLVGLTVRPSEKAHVVLISSETHNLRLTDKGKGTFDRETIDSAPSPIWDGKQLFVPLRFIASKFGLVLKWNAADKRGRVEQP